MGGKWWGGYYGWAWPHGSRTIVEPLLIAAMNALLLNGCAGYLEIPRGQLARLLELGRCDGGRLLVRTGTPPAGPPGGHWSRSTPWANSGTCHRRGSTAK